jgi:hypothetical protein
MQQSRPATSGRFPSRPEPARPERPSRSPSDSSPTPRISILACLLNIEIRVISARTYSEQIVALAYLNLAPGLGIR